ncbi:NAD(P)-dependent oxidoreductase [Sporolactobacillus spathodeae]|uniref:D-lactate dehydrogenase n=1 Tax=Sporolactobacillus spathodeae TaxID=1465502 RepID=A0ABS2Q503_9BACL|nr:NAD(P)-dependent oxidoreductase [Sporolactobacillus spathodeae]MBM7656856.1 D-lactate dehydrogenase [Sporolactobacillus spathodeae]
MAFKIIAYGVEPYEEHLYTDLNKYGYQVTLVNDLLTADNGDLAEGHDGVLLFVNCLADRANLKKFNDYGIKYVFTRTAGFNHIDLQAAADFGMKVARVPAYSPNAIAELAVNLGTALSRSMVYTTGRTAKLNFAVTETMFSHEIRKSTVGIVGTGHIGCVEAELYKGLGAKLLGYDIFQSDFAKKLVEFKELDELLAESDIVSLHLPYFPGKNENFVGEEFISKMKDGAILVNTARGEIVDEAAVVKAIKSGKLAGFGADVLTDEARFFGKDFSNGEAFPDATIKELIELYPQVLITPHVAAMTDEAVSNMISTSYDNFNAVLTGGDLGRAEVQLPEPAAK